MINRGRLQAWIIAVCAHFSVFLDFFWFLFKSNDLSADWLLVNSRRCHWENFFMNDVAKKSKVNDVIKNFTCVNSMYHNNYVFMYLAVMV